MNYINRINELTLEIMELNKEIEYFEMQFERIDREHKIRSLRGYQSEMDFDYYCKGIDLATRAEIKRLGDRWQELNKCAGAKMNEREKLRREYRYSSMNEYYRPMDDFDIVMYVTANGRISGRSL